MHLPAPALRRARTAPLFLTPLALAAALLAAPPAQAATKNWLCTNNFWDIASCWSGGTVAVAGDQVYVNPVGGANTTLRMDNLSGTQAAALVELNSTSSALAALQMTGGTLNVTNVVVGNSGSGTLGQSAGTMNLGQLRLANQFGATGTYNLSGSAVLNSGNSIVGTGGSGSFNQSGGTHTTDGLYLAFSPETYDERAVGRYTMTGGTLNVNGDFTTVVGTGHFTQSAGNTNLLFGMTMALFATSRGHYELSGGTLNNGGGLFSGDGQGDFVQTGGVHGINGDIVLKAGSRYEMNGGTLSAVNVQLPGGTFTMNGGSFSTASIGNDPTQGVLNLNGGTLTLTGGISVGSVNIGSNASFAQLAGRSLAATTLNNGGNLTQLGTISLLGASRNDGSWALSASTVITDGTLTNAGLLSGHGTIGGSGAFVNTGLLQQSGGLLELASTGANLNSGNWDLQAGGQLRLNGAVLTNQGMLNLNGGSVVGNGTLNNAVGGTVSGRGSITSAFANGGRLVVAGGNTSITQAFANGGSIVLADAGATLNGGAITNSGRIEGQGQVGNAITNSGSIESKGGTLWLAGNLTNSGRLRSGSGSELVVAAGLASNSGTIELAGGSFDNNGIALSNAVSGRITGFGTLRAGSIDNRGQLQLSGGSSAIHGSFVNHSGSATLLSGNSNTTFHDAADFQSGSELRVSAGSVATFFGAVQQRSGASFTGSGSKFFEGGLSIGNSPGTASDAGNVSFGSGNTYLAEIGGTLPGSGFDQYSVAGTLNFGGTLTLVSWDGFTGQAGQRFDLFDWGSSSGSFSSIDASGLLLAGGTVLDTSRLYIDGSILISAVPEPTPAALLLAGIGVLGWLRRRQRVLDSAA